MSLVSLVEIKNANFEGAISEALDLIDYHFSVDIRHVVIKPNMCYYLDYTTGYTTDPNFVASLVRVLRDKISKDVDICVVESDASAMKCKHAFKMLGYEKMAQRNDLTLMNLSEDETEKVSVNVNKRDFTFMLPSTIRRADLLINVPKIKYTMRSAKISGALKNIFGCNPFPKKFMYHEALNEVIVALNKLMKFDLCLVDGNIVFGEETRKLGLVMASRDNVAVDAVCSMIMGISPKKVKCLRLAEEEKIGQVSFMVKGVPLNYFAARYPRHRFYAVLKNQFFYYLAEFGLTSKLGID